MQDLLLVEHYITSSSCLKHTDLCTSLPIDLASHSWNGNGFTSTGQPHSWNESTGTCQRKTYSKFVTNDQLKHPFTRLANTGQARDIV